MMISFKDRDDAARRLAKELASYKDKNPLILAIPRGGVPMGAILAEQLHGELDVVLVHKLGAPDQPELAIGAVDEAGEIYLHPYAKKLGVPGVYLEEEKLEQLHTLGQRRRLFTPHRQPLDPRGRHVIIVDDGVATGSTMAAAIHCIRNKNPKEITVAVPVASIEAYNTIKKKADHVVCLDTPEPFYAVGQFYENFSQVSDEEVIVLLNPGKARSV
jgi:predicted phosphoribosyltransferase